MTIKQRITDYLVASNFDRQKVYNKYEDLLLDGFVSCEKETFKRMVRRVDADLNSKHTINLSSNKKVDANQVEEISELNNKELSSKSNRIKSLEDLIKESNIDLSIWNIDRYVVNKWEVGSNVDGVIVTEPLFQVKAWLSKIIPDEVKFPVLKKVVIPVQKRILNTTNVKKAIKKTIVIADHQIGFLKDIRTGKLTPFHDRKVMDIQMQIIADYEPDEIIFAGDILDCTEASRFTKLPEFYYTLQPSLNEAGWFFSKVREIAPKSKIVFLFGNHESYSKDTELLTDKGFKPISEVTLNDRVAQFDIASNTIVYKEPKKLVSHHSDEVISIEGSCMKQVVTLNHEVIYKGEKVYAKDLLNIDSIVQKEFPLYFYDKEGNFENINDNWLRLLTWVVCDGSLVDCRKYGKNPDKCSKVRVQFKLSKERKLEELQRLLKEMGVPYTIQESKKSGANILQPYIIRIYGSYAKDIFNKLNYTKKFPAYFKDLSKEKAKVFYDTLKITDGHYRFGYLEVCTINKDDKDIIFELFMKHGYIVSCNNKINIGFKKSLIYRVKIKNNDSRIMNDVKIEKISYNDLTYCVEVDTGAIVTRNSGKMGISGNCRVEKYIMENMLFAYNLKPYNKPESVMSLKNLLSLSDIDVDVIDTYPKGAYWINNQLKVIHGEYLSVKKELTMTDYSVIMGHLHGIEQVSKTIHGRDGTRSITVSSVGCSCKIDGTVPGVNSKPDWQQGLIKVESTENSFNIQHYFINDGKCLFDSKYYEGKDYEESIKDVIYFNEK